jgi:hypothetical protein
MGVPAVVRGLTASMATTATATMTTTPPPSAERRSSVDGMGAV